MGVVSLAEGLALREAGITADILVLGTLQDNQLAEAVAFRLTPVVSDRRLLTALGKTAATLNGSLPIHVKLDTGMGRLGFSPDDIPSLIEALEAATSLRVEGIMTHLADADGEDQDYTEHQLRVFEDALERLRKAGFQPPFVHAANSAALVRFPHARLSMVRPGIMLYGYQTLPDSVACPSLQPVLSLKTLVAHLRKTRPADSVSYNRTFIAKRPTTIAVLPIGYADGYNRSLSNRGMVLIRGWRAPIVGSICMDMTIADVTDIPSVQIGDEVVLIGRQGEEVIGADQIAEWTGTIPYEVLCGIGPRVPRVYRSS